MAAHAEGVLARPAVPVRDGLYRASFRVHIEPCLAVTKAGSPRYELLVSELVRSELIGDVQPVAMTLAGNKGGLGQTDDMSTCTQRSAGEGRLRRRSF